MDIFTVHRWRHDMCEAYFWKGKGWSSSSPLSSIYCRQLVLLWCLAFKEHQGNPVLFSLDSFDTWVCVLGFYAWRCAIHTHTTHGKTLTQAEAHSVKHASLHIHKQTPSMQCSKYNDCILAPFSPGWWQVFFSSHMVEMKSNYICNGSPTLPLLWRSQLAWVTTVGPKCAQ